jgi:DNA-binding GntR family transcriptional regulator
MVIYHFNQSITQSPGDSKIHKEQKRLSFARVIADSKVWSTVDISGGALVIPVHRALVALGRFVALCASY